MESRIIIYARRSAANLDAVDVQVERSRELAGMYGRVEQIIRDNAGGKTAKRRPGYRALLTAVDNRECDVVIVHSVHLLGRDLTDLLSMLATMRCSNVRLLTVVEALDSQNGLGILESAELLAAFARFQKRERIIEGQQRARQQGITIGRPRTPEKIVKRVAASLESGIGIREIGRSTGVSPATVLRVRDQMQSSKCSAVGGSPPIRTIDPTSPD